MKSTQDTDIDLSKKVGGEMLLNLDFEGSAFDLFLVQQPFLLHHATTSKELVLLCNNR